MNLLDLQKECRTIRRYMQDPVPKDVIEYALENARLCSCGSNMQQLRYVAVTSKEKVEALKPLVKWAAALPPEIGTPHDDEQPTAFIVVCTTSKAVIADIDMGIAAHAITMALCEKGFGSCMMMNIKVPEIAELFKVPEDLNARMVIAIGKARNTSTIVDMKNNEFKYYVDDDRNYYVPKRAFSDIVRFE